MTTAEKIAVTHPINGHFTISLYDRFGEFLKSVKSTNTEAYDRYNNLADDDDEVENFGYTYEEAVIALFNEVNR